MLPPRRYSSGCPLRWLALCALLLLWLPRAAAAVTVTGIMVYSTDDFGNPNGSNAIIQGTFQAQMWRTLIQGEWHVLGVIEGLPPDNLNRPFLNYPDLSVDLPLDEGENYFTLLGEPGPITATDDYQRFCVNLYFDGDHMNPGISVLFPRFADPNGSSVSPTRANEDQVYSLTLQNVGTTPSDYYDDGFYRVSILRASFLAPERANLSIDRMMRQGIGASGTSDWVGSLVLMVEPSETFAARAGRSVPVASDPRRPGSAGAGTAVGGGAPAYVPPVLHGGRAAGPPIGPGYEGRPPHPGPDRPFWHHGERHPSLEVTDEEDSVGTPTPADLFSAMQQWLAAAATPTPAEKEDKEKEETPAATPRGEATPTTMDASKGGGEETRAPTAVVTGTPTPVSTPSRSAVDTAATAHPQPAGEQRQGE